MSEKKPELVVAVNRAHFAKHHIKCVPYLQEVEFVDTRDYALLPRAYADNKQSTGEALGSVFAQVLPYTLVRGPDGKILTYQRKGSEEGLRGMWSIGCGGHITQEDMYNVILSKVGRVSADIQPTLGELIIEGFQREIAEEIGVVVDLIHQPENPLLGFDSIINMNDSLVDRVHVAYVFNLNLTADDLESFNPSEDEFLDWHWASAAELKAGIDDYRGSGKPFENWSRVLINAQKDEV